MVESKTSRDVPQMLHCLSDDVEVAPQLGQTLR